MDRKIEVEIETWNDGKWRYEIEIDGEIIENGVLDSYSLCAGRCLEIITRPTPVAADECHSCGAIDMFSGDVCIECGIHR